MDIKREPGVVTPTNEFESDEDEIEEIQENVNTQESSHNILFDNRRANLELQLWWLLHQRYSEVDRLCYNLLKDVAFILYQSNTLAKLYAEPDSWRKCDHFVDEMALDVLKKFFEKIDQDGALIAAIVQLLPVLWNEVLQAKREKREVVRLLEYRSHEDTRHWKSATKIFRDFSIAAPSLHRSSKSRQVHSSLLQQLESYIQLLERIRLCKLQDNEHESDKLIKKLKRHRLNTHRWSKWLKYFYRSSLPQLDEKLWRTMDESPADLFFMAPHMPNENNCNDRREIEIVDPNQRARLSFPFTIRVGNRSPEDSRNVVAEVITFDQSPSNDETCGRDNAPTHTEQINNAPSGSYFNDEQSMGTVSNYRLYDPLIENSQAPTASPNSMQRRESVIARIREESSNTQSHQQTMPQSPVAEPSGAGAKRNSQSHLTSSPAIPQPPNNDEFNRDMNYQRGPSTQDNPDRMNNLPSSQPRQRRKSIFPTKRISVAPFKNREEETAYKDQFFSCRQHRIETQETPATQISATNNAVPLPEYNADRAPQASRPSLHLETESNGASASQVNPNREFLMTVRQTMQKQKEQPVPVQLPGYCYKRPYMAEPSSSTQAKRPNKRNNVNNLSKSLPSTAATNNDDAFYPESQLDRSAGQQQRPKPTQSQTKRKKRVTFREPEMQADASASNHGYIGIEVHTEMNAPQRPSDPPRFQQHLARGRRKSEVEKLLEYTESFLPDEGKRQRPTKGMYCEHNMDLELDDDSLCEWNGRR